MINLVIADDHPVVREGIKRIVEACAGMTVVGEAASGAEAIAKCRENATDVLLLDISMPGPGFLRVIEQLRAHCPGLRVLVLSAHDEQSYALRALRAGAAGYLNKAHSVEALEGAIRRVASGRRYVSPALAEMLADQMVSGLAGAPHDVLSAREYQVFCALGAGKRVTEVAAEMCLSPKTVSTYRTRILRKMHLEGNAALIRYAVRNDLV